jgi:hypothetical protein
MKKPRKIVSFEPEPDVKKMLEAARAGGLTITNILHGSLRECGQEVINRLVRERQRQLTKLSESFCATDRQPDQFLIAA